MVDGKAVQKEPKMMGQRRVQQLEKDSTGLWTGIGKEIAARIKELKNEH
jgi:hypothetical protein